MSARFLFLITEGFDETVIDSQVVDTLSALREQGLPFDLLALCDGRNWLERRAYYGERRRAIAERTGARVGLWPIVRKLDRAGVAAALPPLAATLGTGLRNALVHCRGEWSARFAAHLARVFPGVRFVYDCRGDGEAEYVRDAETRRVPRAEVERMVAKIQGARALAVRDAALVLAVSTALRDLLADRYGLPLERSRVIPGAADERKFHLDEAEREATRRELGLTGFTLVYPGRFGRWHYNEETLRVVRGLLDADPSAFFLILTPDLGPAEELAKRLLPDGRYSIRAAAHAEVPRFLRAADLGLLLRAPDPINVVACPTKFAEFTMSGLPVLISAGIGDCSTFVAERNAGAVLAEPDPAAAVAAVTALRAEDGSARRARIADAGRAHFSRQRHAAALAEAYRRIVAESSSR